MSKSAPHAFQASGLAYARTLRHHDAAEWARPIEPPEGDNLAGDRQASRSSIIGGGMRREAVLAVGCGEHHAAPGVPCYRSKLSPVRGFCWERWQRGVGAGDTRVLFGNGWAR